jgi:hypothetical protein
MARASRIGLFGEQIITKINIKKIKMLRIDSQNQLKCYWQKILG